MSELINVNGTISPAGEAVVPVMDHGFLYGDGVYETLRTYDGEPSLLDRHLQRLNASCDKIRVAPLAAERVVRELRRTVALAANDECYIRIMVSRGVGSIGYESSLSLTPSLVIIVLPLKRIPASSYENGVKVVLGVRRRNPVDSLDPAIKSCNLLNNILAHMEAQDARATETILLNTRGILTEGSHTNVFFVSGGVLKTPSLTCGILSGITREVTLEVARKANVPVEEGEYTAEDLALAEEVFVTSTLQELLPATSLGGNPVGTGAPGPVTLKLLNEYRKSVGSGTTAGN